MHVLVPLAVAVPLLAAAILTAVGRLLPPRIVDALAAAVAAATAVVTGVLLVHAWGGSTVYWFGGWHPRGGLAIGIAFVVDPIGAGLACFAALVVTGALVFSWHYFDEVLPLYHALVLVFLGAMVGFSLTGDLFDLFVFFELMSVAAYALTGYEVQHPGPLQGAINFAVVNSLGSFAILCQAHANRLADARGAAGDRRHSSVEPHHAASGTATTRPRTSPRWAC